VDCSVYREAASARLDGEALGMSTEALSAHLGQCADCEAWLAQATRLTRTARVGQDPAPDLSEWILHAVPLAPRRVHGRLGGSRAVTALRIGLAIAGMVQLATTAPALAGDGMAMAMSTHAAHESAAWNIAVAIGFLAVAASPRRAAGALPVLGAFALVLTLLSVPDFMDGAVDAERLATHLGALAGVLIMLALHRTRSRADGSPTAATGWPQQLGDGLTTRLDEGDGPPGGVRAVA
jgi:predicted anti-sigma-YlaC factor YlaD